MYVCVCVGRGRGVHAGRQVDENEYGLEGCVVVVVVCE